MSVVLLSVKYRSLDGLLLELSSFVVGFVVSAWVAQRRLERRTHDSGPSIVRRMWIDFGPFSAVQSGSRWISCELGCPMSAVASDGQRTAAETALSQTRDQPPAEIEGKRRPEGLPERRRDQQRQDTVGRGGRAVGAARQPRADERQPRFLHLRVLKQTIQTPRFYYSKSPVADFCQHILTRQSFA